MKINKGTIFNSKRNGKDYFTAQITIGYDDSGNRIRKSFSSFDKKEVKSKLLEYSYKCDKNILTVSSETIFQDWYHEWLFQYRKLDLKPSSFQRYESIYRNYILDTDFGNTKLSDIKKINCQKHLNKISETKTSATARTVKKCISTCLKAAVDEDIILKNYCSQVKLPQAEHKANRYKHFTEEEQKEIINHLKLTAVDMAIKLDFATGLRLGELTGLKWSDIDFSQCTVDINKALKQVQIIESDTVRKSELILQTPKTQESIRIIPIPTSLISDLKKWKHEQKLIMMKHKDIFQDNDFVFTNELGEPLEQRKLPRRLEKIQKDLDMPYRNFHCIRHTYATRLFEANVNVKIVQGLLGHKDIATTLNIYTHVSNSKQTEAVNKLNSLFG